MRTFQSAATSNGRRASGAYWNRGKAEGCCRLESPRSGGGAKMRPSRLGAPVSDPACWCGTLDLAGSETGAPVAVIRRARAPKQV